MLKLSPTEIRDPEQSAYGCTMPFLMAIRACSPTGRLKPTMRSLVDVALLACAWHSEQLDGVLPRPQETDLLVCHQEQRERLQ